MLSPVLLCGGLVVVGTLLGFWGITAVAWWFLGCCGHRGCRLVRGWWWVSRVVVENCTVDMSIFVEFCMCCKLLSAVGGCLGTKSR